MCTSVTICVHTQTHTRAKLIAYNAGRPLCIMLWKLYAKHAVVVAFYSKIIMFNNYV